MTMGIQRDAKRTTEKRFEDPCISKLEGGRCPHCGNTDFEIVGKEYGMMIFRCTKCRGKVII